MGFTKLDERILQSSIMAESAITFKVWITLLAACRQNGVAYVSSVYIASIAHLPLKKVDESLLRLESPDVNSRSLRDDGRRIRRVDGGYEIINYSAYRDAALKDAEAERKRVYRERKSDCPDKSGRCPDSSASASASESVSDSASSSLSSSSLQEEDARGRLEAAAEIVGYLNEKAGKKFNPKSRDTAEHISARLAEGRTVEDFKRVIDVKVAKWKGKQWTGQRGDVVHGDDLLRPSTLFRPTNFENYLNESMPTEEKKPPSKYAGIGTEV